MLGGAPAPMDQPSNKLFFAGLPDSLTEETFRAMMEKFPGFEAARLRHDRAGQWVGFVDFKEESEATTCKNAMAGAKLDPNNSALVTVRYSGQKKQSAASGLAPLGAGPGMGGPGGPLSSGKRPFEPAFEPPPPPGPPPGWNGGPMGGGPMDGGMGMMGGVPMPSGPPPGMMGGPMESGMGDAPLPPGPPPGMGGIAAANEPAPLPMGPPPGVAGGGNRMLLVEGLPEDGTRRELLQLFRFLPGFVSVEGPAEPSEDNGRAKRFTVEFVSAVDAGAAIAVRQGMLFDPAQPTSALKIGFAPTSA